MKLNSKALQENFFNAKAAVRAEFALGMEERHEAKEKILAAMGKGGLTGKAFKRAWTHAVRRGAAVPNELNLPPASFIEATEKLKKAEKALFGREG